NAGTPSSNDANRSEAHEQRIGKDAEQRASQSGHHIRSIGEPMAKELVIAIFEIRTDERNLETGVLEQFDERGSRVEDQMRTEVLRKAPALGQEIQQALGIKRGQKQKTPRLE